MSVRSDYYNFENSTQMLDISVLSRPNLNPARNYASSESEIFRTIWIEDFNLVTRQILWKSLTVWLTFSRTVLPWLFSVCGDLSVTIHQHLFLKRKWRRTLLTNYLLIPSVLQSLRSRGHCHHRPVLVGYLTVTVIYFVWAINLDCISLRRYFACWYSTIRSFGLETMNGRPRGEIWMQLVSRQTEESIKVCTTCLRLLRFCGLNTANFRSFCWCTIAIPFLLSQLSGFSLRNEGLHFTWFYENWSV